MYIREYKRNSLNKITIISIVVIEFFASGSQLKAKYLHQSKKKILFLSRILYIVPVITQMILKNLRTYNIGNGYGDEIRFS